MSGDWIKMRINLTTDPAVGMIAELTKLDRFGVVGRLHALWGWADEHSTDGAGLTVSRNWIDEFVGRKGFAAALERAKWLAGPDFDLSFPEFGKHNGHTAKERALSNKRVADHREVKRKGNAKGDQSVTAQPLQKALPDVEGEREEDKKKPGREVVTPKLPVAPLETAETVGSVKTANGEGDVAEAGAAPISADWRPLPWVQARIDAGGVTFTPTAATIATFVAHHRARPGEHLRPSQWSWKFVTWCIRQAGFDRTNGHAAADDQAAVIAEAMRLTSAGRPS